MISEQPDEEDRQSFMNGRKRLKRKPIEPVDEGEYSEDSFDAATLCEPATIRIKFSDIETKVNCNQSRGLFVKQAARG